MIRPRDPFLPHRNPYQTLTRKSVRTPLGLEHLIVSCLAKKRDERPATVMDVLAALDDISLDDPWTEESAERWWVVQQTVSTR